MSSLWHLTSEPQSTQDVLKLAYELTAPEGKGRGTRTQAKQKRPTKKLPTWLILATCCCAYRLVSRHVSNLA